VNKAKTETVATSAFWQHSTVKKSTPVIQKITLETRAIKKYFIMTGSKLVN
jgi:hypothetical protein